ncbi:hypothetical protein OH76DRAFT_177519 [Lentinus brumalis]|uniref:BTB domain-containing protein n=1 Tax=Lentinus brumalis TaxID=2498619 RepID=A0A371CNE9_9APHY|nr:hypothetical protein OH76DRAFT_177519 [Polyporus brumalis]
MGRYPDEACELVTSTKAVAGCVVMPYPCTARHGSRTVRRSKLSEELGGRLATRLELLPQHRTACFKHVVSHLSLSSSTMEKSSNSPCEGSVTDMDDIDTLDSFSVVTASSTDVAPEEDSQRNSVLQKDAEFWLDDGTVVIVANDTVAFRVYKGALANVSPAFRDLTAIADASKEQEMMDGIPVVHVDDAPESLRRFLRFVVLPRFDTIHPLVTFRLSYASLAAVGRIGRKYQVESAVRPVASRLLRFLTPSAVTWIDDTRSWVDRWQWWKKHNAIVMEAEDAIDAVNLLQLLEEPAGLPFALYLCCLCTPVQLRNGSQREDGTVARLSDEDYERCVRGSLLLAQAGRSTFQFAICRMKQEKCRMKLCKVVLEQMSRVHASDLLGSESYPLSDVFIRLDLRNPVPSAYGKVSGQLCAGCKEELCNWSVVAARDIFAELSETFGLQSTKTTAAEDEESADDET